MNPLRIAILSSGTGSTVQCICHAVKYNILNAKIVTIVSNIKQLECPIQTVHSEFKLYDPETTFQRLSWNKKEHLTRHDYDVYVADILKTQHPDLIVFAGWKHIVTRSFISQFDNIINLHPALYGSFTGLNCIQKAYNAFQNGEITYTGSMVHEVIEDLDKGQLICQIKVPIFKSDTLSDLEKRVKQSEKGILISAIQTYINKHNETFIS